MYNLNRMKEKVIKYFPGVVMTTACLAVIAAGFIGANSVMNERLENKKNTIIESEDILKKLGLSGKVPLINNQGYFSYPEVRGIKQVSFDLGVRQTDGTVWNMKVVFPKENAVPIDTADPNAKPAVLFKPENFVTQNEGLLDMIHYSVIIGNNPKILKPVGEVPIYFSPADYSKFQRGK